MRCFRNYLYIISLLFLFVTNGVFAINTGFSTEELSENDRSTFASNINISVLKEKPVDRAIECFDVSENGMIAIGQDGIEEKVLCVYSSDGEFQYGYTFNCTQSFGVEWDGQDINIYFVRSDVLLTVNKEGEIIDIVKVQNTTENNTYRNYMLCSTERTSGDTKYTIRNDMGFLNAFSSSYSQLIVTKSTGEEIILYDVNSDQLTKTLTVFILAVIFFLLAVGVITWQFIRLKRTYSGTIK